MHAKTKIGLPLYLAVVAAYGLFFMWWRVEAVDVESHLAALSVWAVALIPMLIWYTAGQHGAPMFELVCLMCGIAYSTPVYLVPNEITIQSQSVTFTSAEIFECLILAAAAIMALMAGYYGVSQLARRVRFARLDLPIAERHHTAYVRGALLVGLGMQVLSLFWQPAEAIRAIARVLSSQFYIGIVLLAYSVGTARRRHSFDSVVLWLAVGIGTLFGLSGGMLETAFVPIALVFIVRWHVRGKFPIGLSTLGVTMFLILNPLKGEYREMTWFGEYADAGPVERLSAWTVAAGNVFGQSSTSDYSVREHNVVQQSAARFDLLHKFAQVRSLTPSTVPYFGGITYSYLLYTYVPRVIWPAKPLATEATDVLDFSYGLRSPNQESNGTNIGVGQVAEAFANFGSVGVVIVMVIQGAIFALLERILNGPNSIGGRAIYVAVMVFFLNGIGTAAVILFGFIIQFVIATGLLMWPFIDRTRQKSQRKHAIDHRFEALDTTPVYQRQ